MFKFIDWSRVGMFVRSGTHRYSAEQILTRSLMIGFGALSGYLGYQYNDEKRTHCSSSTFSIVTGVIGFLASHTYTMYPIVKKRWDMNAECDKRIQEIKK